MGSRYDLSRRVVVLPMPPFSFGEFLHFSKGEKQPHLTLDEILADHQKLYPKLQVYETYFVPFCTGYALPSYLSAPQPQTIQNILEKIVHQDMLSLAKLNAEDIASIMRLLRFASMAGVDGVSYSSLAANCAIPKHRVPVYVSLLQKAFVLEVILPKGTNVNKEPKILISLPFRPHLAPSLDEDRLSGAMREEFFVHHMQGRALFYLKSNRGEKLADYLLVHKGKKLVFEIGGAGKTQEQFKGIVADGKFVLTQPGNPKRGIPLILFGFLKQD
jgi:predicted AAA+ superfamily ATPase